MLQTTNSVVQAAPEGLDQGLDLSHYLAILKRRIFHILIPTLLVFAIGFSIAMMLPPVFVSQGRILVESQQIPTELVRPTVTASAKERIQVIEQRVMSRDNLLAIADKFQVFSNQKKRMSSTDVLDLMRERARIGAVELDLRSRRDSFAIAVTVSFEHERPDMASKVANELMTLVLREDARNRTSRASETARFLEREVLKLQETLGRIDAQIFEFKKRNSERVPDRVILQLAALKAELEEKSSVFSAKHPDLIRLRRQVEALENATKRTAESESGFDALLSQRSGIQKNLEETSLKLAAARLGESLEQGQYSERLEVIEQAVTPQKPVKPNRQRIIALAFALAMMAGLGTAFAAESFDGSIRGRRDLLAVADGRIVIALPYIQTKADLRRKRRRVAFAAATAVVVLATGLVATHLLVRPLDELWASLLARLLV